MNNSSSGFSALQRAEIAEMHQPAPSARRERPVSVLFNEPKLLKSDMFCRTVVAALGFSALQRAEIAEIVFSGGVYSYYYGGFSALQRAEIAEIHSSELSSAKISSCFSALQRAEIAEIVIPLSFQCSAFQFQCSSTSRNC